MSAATSGLEGLTGVLAANRRGEHRGVTSVCSAHPVVLDAATRRAARRGSLLCIESTAAQVNQEGGYTGLTPAGFADGVRAAAAAAGVPGDRLVLGGDHLGPFPGATCRPRKPWRGRPVLSGTACSPATRSCTSTPA